MIVLAKTHIRLSLNYLVSFDLKEIINMHYMIKCLECYLFIINQCIMEIYQFKYFYK
jgi:hypothetical protein